MALEFSDSDRIWNRAIEERGNPALKRGDSSLGSLLLVHGLICNGGVLHSFQCVSDAEFSDAIAGYEYFGFLRLAELLKQARTVASPDQIACGDVDDELSQALDRNYYDEGDDCAIETAFKDRLRDSPGDFAPL